MAEFTIKEMTDEEWQKFLVGTIEVNGLRGAVKYYLDEIVGEAHGLGYVQYSTIAEYAQTILDLIDSYTGGKPGGTKEGTDDD